MVPNIDAKEAIDRTKEFLEDYQDSFNLESAKLVNNEWVIVCDVGFLSEEIKEVKVDADSGKILGYVDVETD